MRRYEFRWVRHGNLGSARLETLDGISVTVDMSERRVTFGLLMLKKYVVLYFAISRVERSSL